MTIDNKNKLTKIFGIVSILLTLYFFTKFNLADTWFKGYLEQLIGNDPRDILATGFLASLVAFFAPIIICLLPIFIVGSITLFTIDLNNNPAIFFIIIEVLAGVGAGVIAYVLLGNITIAALIGIAISVWITYVLIQVSKILKLCKNFNCK